MTKKHEKRIYIDCRLLKNAREIHESLKEQLSFPEYYGKNLDALVDVLTDITLETKVVVIWKDTLRSRITADIRAIKKVLKEFVAFAKS
jgi:ribonuclease inhibitor